jgi:ribosomal silencing factor RsfS
VKKRSTNVGPNLYPTVEGRDSDQWMVVDCGNLVVHVFREDVRSYYNLEELWQRNKTMSLLE